MTGLSAFIERQPRWRWATAGGIAIVAILLFLVLDRGSAGRSSAATFTARRGPLDISVTEGGSVQAEESQEVKCEVRVGYQGTKILKIIEEGSLVTEEDVQQGKVLVELDSSDIQKQLVQQEIQYQSAAASLTDAQQGLDIQANQNVSDIKAAEQKARFARMDFSKYLGEAVALRLLADLGLGTEEATVSTNASAATPPDTASSNLLTRVDFSRFATVEQLGDGEAKQKLRELEDTLQVGKKELGQTQSTLEGTQRLFAREFVTKVDLERDEVAFENSRLKVQKAETARDLFLKYDFPKAAEEFLSKYLEARRELDRARKAAVSKLAQAEAKYKSAQAQHSVQERQLGELKEQLSKCVIKATKPGLVVYGAGGDEQIWYGGEERIREGATVRERQAIITIPDLSKMCVKVKIHESYIKKIRKGQKARITVDAFADRQLAGEVTKVGVLPDSQNRWMNPDMKVYLTTITIDGAQEWLKPGMTAKVEVLVDRLEDVVYVPIQSVTPREGRQVCFVVNGSGAAARPVEVGDFNDEFIAVKSGLNAGEIVLLKPPGAIPAATGEQATPAAEKPAETPRPSAPATPATASATKA